MNAIVITWKRGEASGFSDILPVDEFERPRMAARRTGPADRAAEPLPRNQVRESANSAAAIS
jgi:hypothetical protein